MGFYAKPSCTVEKRENKTMLNYMHLQLRMLFSSQLGHMQYNATGHPLAPDTLPIYIYIYIMCVCINHVHVVP